MKRSYNIFVDNGLFIASNHLDKDIEDITLEDLKNSTGYFSNLIFKFISCGRYSKISSMGFNNSSYTQPAYKDNRLQKIKEQFDSLFNNMGNDEICTICGERHIKLYGANLDFIKSLSRSLMPGLPANTFFNYSNNLQIINVCPVCLYLSMISILNMRKAGNNLILYNSDNEAFMYGYTNYIQNQINIDILQDSLEDKTKTGSNKAIIDSIKWIVTQEKVYQKGYIHAACFYNGQVPQYSHSFISEKYLMIIKKLSTNGLLPDFEKCGLFNAVIKGSLEYSYLYYLIDVNNKEIKCDLELIKFLNEEICNMDKETLKIIEEICPKIEQINKNPISAIRDTFKFADFHDLITKWQMEYAEKHQKLLFDSNEKIQAICNVYKWKGIKNYMISQFVINNYSEKKN